MGHYIEIGNKWHSHFKTHFPEKNAHIEIQNLLNFQNYANITNINTWHDDDLISIITNDIYIMLI